VIIDRSDTQVDRIPNVLISLKVVDGCLEEHHGFSPKRRPSCLNKPDLSSNMPVNSNWA
jgi:hypothetical protein